MYVYLVVFHGAELKNECFNTWNCTVWPLSVGFTTPGHFLGQNQGGCGMLDLEFFQKKFFSKFFGSKIIFSDVDYILTVFFIILVHNWGGGEGWDLVIFRDFSQ